MTRVLQTISNHKLDAAGVPAAIVVSAPEGTSKGVAMVDWMASHAFFSTDISWASAVQILGAIYLLFLVIKMLYGFSLWARARLPKLKASLRAKYPVRGRP